MSLKPETWVALYDIHYPKVHWRTFQCALSFIQANRISGLVLGGDQHDNECISHHTKGKPLYRTQGQFKRETEGFRVGILEPLEAALKSSAGAQKVWIRGNHERFVFDFIEENPELDGQLDREGDYGLVAKGWTIVELGRSFKKDKLRYIHGEMLTGKGNQASIFPSRKAVDMYPGNILAGHTHSPQTYTKISPVEHTQKWQGHIAPIVGNVNPGYLRNAPTAWLNGFVIIEYHGVEGNFNLFPVITTNGRFAYGGRIYKAS